MTHQVLRINTGESNMRCKLLNYGHLSGRLFTGILRPAITAALIITPAAVLAELNDGDINIDGNIDAADILWGQQTLLDPHTHSNAASTRRCSPTG